MIEKSIPDRDLGRKNHMKLLFEMALSFLELVIWSNCTSRHWVDMAKWLLKISPGDICNQMSVDGIGWSCNFWSRIVYKNKEYNKVGWLLLKKPSLRRLGRSTHEFQVLIFQSRIREVNTSKSVLNKSLSSIAIGLKFLKKTVPKSKTFLWLIRNQITFITSNNLSY